MLLKTPIYNLKNFPDVYDPSEDSFLLLDTLETDFEDITKINPGFVVEIGSGSGIIITALAASLKDVTCFATDINSEACIATNFTSSMNNTHVEICNMNLLTCFKEELFDVIIFNPPYVVTDTNEVTRNRIARAWAGGINGREVIDQFLQLLPQLMSANGICYMVIIKENNPKEIVNMVHKMDLQAYIVNERKIPCEHLYVLKISR